MLKAVLFLCVEFCVFCFFISTDQNIKRKRLWSWKLWESCAFGSWDCRFIHLPCLFEMGLQLGGNWKKNTKGEFMRMRGFRDWEENCSEFYMRPFVFWFGAIHFAEEEKHELIFHCRIPHGRGRNEGFLFSILQKRNPLISQTSHIESPLWVTWFGSSTYKYAFCVKSMEYPIHLCAILFPVS